MHSFRVHVQSRPVNLRAEAGAEWPRSDDDEALYRDVAAMPERVAGTQVLLSR